jgi:DNA-binding CsgD family transcriptional regulator
MSTLLSEILEGEPLNERETEILAGAAEGETAIETAQRLYLSAETVKSYRKRIIAKLGARNGTHAVALALRSGLLALDRPPDWPQRWLLSARTGAAPVPTRSRSGRRSPRAR